ncbi:ribonuclease kappa-B [Ischnura elegans]|uniref:ribonuclease kappa-B n=1 Tax=Ischnura elegans TaxID=197161 RepID=UPI001ED87652|nr:ribonuclease kappa-B [Ischnura elegans]
MKICGPKLSLCGLIISTWGIIQLILMGIFYYVQSVALAEDIALEGSFSNIEEFYSVAERGYTQTAYNCWIAALFYIFTLVISGHQFYVNSRASSTM